MVRYRELSESLSDGQKARFLAVCKFISAKVFNFILIQFIAITSVCWLVGFFRSFVVISRKVVNKSNFIKFFIKSFIKFSTLSVLCHSQSLNNLLR